MNNLGLELNLIFLQYRTAISVGWSNFLKVLKENAGGIFEVPELIQTTTFSLKGRLTVPRIQILIGYAQDPNTSVSTYSHFFPAIYLNEDHCQDEYLFCGEILYKVNFPLRS